MTLTCIGFRPLPDEIEMCIRDSPITSDGAAQEVLLFPVRAAIIIGTERR